MSPVVRLNNNGGVMPLLCLFFVCLGLVNHGFGLLARPVTPVRGLNLPGYEGMPGYEGIAGVLVRGMPGYEGMPGY